jgi:regulator of sigma E protease
MLSLLAPILVFGLVIFIHELGHFLAAKAVGVYAPRFSIGFGPSLFKFRRGETEYIVAALPIGGYVRMASRLDEEVAFMEGGNEADGKGSERDDYDPEAMIPFGPKPVPEDRWFESKPLPARLLIMIAGVTMNVILAIVIFSSIAFRLGRDTTPTTTVGSLGAASSITELRALQTGDTITAIDGKPVATWNDVFMGIASGHGDLAIRTKRGEIKVPATDSTRVVIATNLIPFVPAVIDSLVAGERAAAAGFRRGDSIVALNGEPIRTWTDITSKITTSIEQPLRFTVIRAGEQVTLAVTPRATVVGKTKSGADSVAGKIGAATRTITVHESIGLGGAVVAGLRETRDKATGVVDVVRALVKRQVSMRQLGGPIAIGRASVNAARSGAADLFYLIAFLSINVAVLNMLPIPILDGGQILINVIESAKGSPFSLRTREYILRFGLAAIALLFIVVMFNDTRGGFSKLFNWMFR